MSEQPDALFQIGEDLPPALPKRAAWGTASKLRQWQQEALEQYFSAPHKDFLTVATPGAGKTTFALRVAKMLKESGVISRMTVVAPTEHLKKQWADSAARIGLAIDPNFKNSDGHHGREYMGVALTYAQVAQKPVLHRNRTEAARTLVILDEVHHGGDALSWGDSIKEAFEPAARRLSLTGTPFRSDDAQIPFVRYADQGDGVLRSQADYTYGYGPALKDHVVRPVIFMAYSGQMRWQTSTGEVMEAQLGEAATKDMTQSAWRTALNPEGQWIPSVLKAADRRLSEVRRNVPDAGGLVIATDHEDARAYAAQLQAVCGEPVTTVLSDDPTASEKIESFTTSDQRWMVAVRMVSEGVDVPRLCVGVYATSTSTPMFFAQAVGRFVRSRKRGETASVFLPSVPKLMALANELETERDHALQVTGAVEVENLEEAAEERELKEANRQESASSRLTEGTFRALESDAAFDKVLFDGGEFGAGAAVGSAEELDFLGIPGLLDAEQVSILLKQHQANHLKNRTAKSTTPSQDPAVVDHRQMKELRKKLSSMVSAWAARSGTPHGVIHNRLREISGGPAVAQASREQLQTRINTLQKWFVGKK
ncbi:DEAD/DEAH box helicase [Auritidibacter sp. NML130574]|uniref:DEAD/DEAH box helicase n=1 Tax=Auritidibacter sp. NML130574 TaxID=2170745 RepID=UPI000D734DBC|nr:DEAD/DEAH box helicase [Auritidibacter sp. NML130574]AXR73245.1 DEAD/DEAH box helicase [Auritidibacter sp. NML130574]